MADNLPYGLGRNHEPDSRDHNYRAINILPQLDMPIKTKYWSMNKALDQGRLPWCVDYSLETCMMGAPTKLNKPVAPFGTIYNLAQTLDDTPGTNYDGTSVRAGNQSLVQLGIIKEYRWMLTLDEILRLLSNYGPVVMGTNWYENMFYPNKSGTISIAGDIAGGHAYCLSGNDVKNKRVRKLGTWGALWGQNGRAWIGWDTLERLLYEQGEASLPVQ